MPLYEKDKRQIHTDLPSEGVALRAEGWREVTPPKKSTSAKTRTRASAKKAPAKAASRKRATSQRTSPTATTPPAPSSAPSPA